ncbi:magnesium chelatase [Candidatus Kuenenbacteria bacterium RIFCSPHIGHO2_12_FULL_42_14]|uniref:Magnesium chelatase n=2 Tax=Candidatus Kueneniibacteriota TaxID=1752740 RepID=A0A1F6GKH2_9BACT|nr:MAG: magnesium chelatase [Candidatus Kuenenbacteria bacterium RIFCSPHIGHO2_02_FULL_42_29]OGG89744.1 MAG: magnesium chelatase [Candidatus Kuenenbacteria bacterium RIFCSPLOWO2_02_FULL_42_16]OGG98609.1 MAG: magnesium chelatase [Candidatus Kuenenbacteria bacterium RIFCSPHIGHO2_12_FULL_42_14]
MSTKILSAAVIGLNCELVEVEADSINAIPKLIIVGLPDLAVQESKQRVRSAVKNSGFPWPRGQITVNLAPADLKKAGPAYDLPIALAILIAGKHLHFSGDYDQAIFVGELALDGHLRPVSGILPLAIMARDLQIKKIFVPDTNAAEAALINNLEVYPASSLAQVVLHLTGEVHIALFTPSALPLAEEISIPSKFDMAFVQGQEHVKRALEIAAAGQHNILMSGPPGSGKTLLARSMPTILPEMTLEESLEVTKIYSVAGLLPSNEPLVRSRPFRSPHHTASGVSLVGGGAWPRPGEISLAHRGVLFLDEFPEFPRVALDNLRQPLEDGIINISRAAGTLQFPAQFILLASMNPCPCGYHSDPEKNCICTPMQIASYQKKISGPILDRIDIHIEVPRVDFSKLSSAELGESSATIRERVNAARRCQLERFQNMKIISNAEMSSEEVRRVCLVDVGTQELLKNAVQQMRLSARAYYRILKLARTIADLSGEETIKIEHVAEALQYRPKVE